MVAAQSGKHVVCKAYLHDSSDHQRGYSPATGVSEVGGLLVPSAHQRGRQMVTISTLARTKLLTCLVLRGLGDD
jgi:hypothetical protein